MKKTAKFVVLLLVLAPASFGQEVIPSWKPELVNTVAIGQGPGELGYNQPVAGAYYGPGRLIAYKDKLYIPDTLNGRVNIYNMNWKYEGVLKLPGNGAEDVNRCQSISFFDDGDFLCWTNTANLVRVTTNGDRVFSLGHEKLYPTAFTNWEYWIWKDYVLYYAENGSPKVIDKLGQFLDDKEMQQLLTTMKESSRLRAASDRVRKAIDDFLTQNQLFLIGDRLLTMDNVKMTALFKTVHDVKQDRTNVAATPGTTVSVLRGNLYNAELGIYYIRQGTGETAGYYAILKYDGSVLAKFQLDMAGPPINRQAISVHGVIADNGDIYGYDLDRQRTPHEFRFYRLHKQW
jgi:hypothetical protein